MLNCVCIDPGDCGCDYFKKAIRKARKAHTCGECGATITPGERYEHVSACWEGEPETCKTCLICVRIRDELLPCGFYFGGVWSEIHQANCIDYEGDDDFCICPTRDR